MEALSGVLMLPVLILLLVLAILAVLLPYFVYATASRTLKLLTETQEQAKSIKKIQQLLERNVQLLDARQAGQSQLVLGVQDAGAADQLHTNNKLLRQLLRAYGHEPEA
jgi:membrane protein implicated in regulation of membrane protease activity